VAGAGPSNRVARLDYFGPRPVGRPGNQLLSYYLKSGQICEFNIAFPTSKIIQTFHEATFEYVNNFLNWVHLKFPIEFML
jgi:hypothetical protein